jgi:hypothetical protein
VNNSPDDLHTLRLMDALSESQRTTQRELSRRAGISLGLTNLLLERMARRAWVKLTSISGRRMLYALTPKGLTEKARKTRDWVRHTYRYFAETRGFLVEELGKKRCVRVVCYGAGPLADLVRDAAREARVRVVGQVSTPHELGGVACDGVVLVDKPSRAALAEIRRRVHSVIDLT